MKTQAQSLGTIGRLIGLGLAVLTVLVLGTVQSAGAQVDRVTCGFFETQADAQAALDARPELATTLDGDGNGIACEELQTGGPVVVDPASCGHFETQADAQAALEENPELSTTLDSDGDGIACEDAFETGDRTFVVCGEWNGRLVELSEDIVPGSVDFPYHFATQAEIEAGTCAATTPATPGVVVCNEALGALVEVAQGALDQDALDFPYHLATDAEIESGECATVVVCNEANGKLIEVADTEGVLGGLDFPFHRATSEEIAADTCAVTTPVTPEDEREPDGGGGGEDNATEGAEPEKVVALPSTGAGTSGELASPALLPWTLLAMAIGAVALRSRLQRALT